MAIYKAEKTMELIENAISNDQGAKYREWLGKVIPTISDAFDPRQGRRSHFGYSSAGDPCARKLFFGWRWVVKVKHSGRIMRLFNRGHMEEGRFIAALLAAGLTVYQQDANGKQFRLSSLGGHVGSAIDGVLIGCPDLPDPTMAILTEMKTHNDKSFKKLVKEGVRATKPTHYVQMQIYMRKMGLPAALYIATNKNDDDIWAELIPFESVIADQYIDRCDQIALADAPPVGLSEKGASWFECKWCDYNGICYRGEMPEVSCRTCAASEVRADGTWYCRARTKTLTVDEQIEGCSGYVMSNYYG